MQHAAFTVSCGAVGGLAHSTMQASVPRPLLSSSPAPSSTLRAVATAGCCWMTATRLVRVLPSTVLVESVSPDEVLVALPPTATTPVCGGGGSRWVRGC